MTQGLAVQDVYPETHPTVEPQLQLLLERESGYRVFFRNFFDLILRRTQPPLFLASPPVYFRKHFYVRTGVHWMVLLESIVWHMAAVPLLLVLWIWSLSWEVRHYAVERPHATASQEELYYPLAQSFPAREGRQHQEIEPEPATPREHGLRVAKEQQHTQVEGPDVALNGGAHSEIAPADPTLPAVPLSATSRSKLVLPGDLAEAIGPAPDGGQLSLRGMSGPAVTVIAPPPQISRAGRSGIAGLSVGVVAPAPALLASLGPQKLNGIDLGDSTAVPPSPSLALAQQFAGRGSGSGALASSGAAVVPPAPSVSGRVHRPGGSGDLLGGTGTQVVAPSPAMSYGLVLAGGHGNSLAGNGTHVIPPVPSIPGRAYLAGNGGNVIGGTGANVVAPSPVLGNSLVSSSGRGHALGSGTGTGVVPPAPSIVGSGVRGGRGGGSVQSLGDGTGSAVAPTPAIGMMPTHGRVGGGGGTGSLTGEVGQVVAPTPSLAGSGLGGAGNGLGGNGGKALVASLGTQAVAPPGIGSGGSGTGISSGNGAGNGPTATPGSAGGSDEGAGSVGSTGGGETVAGLGKGPIVGEGVGSASGSAPIISTAIPAHAEVPDIPAGKTEVLPLRVIQLALALPMSSYFSNYEAFVAERSVNHDTTQLIKLVYIFLPYQRRLTEFGVKPAKTFNLRVTRDPSCDESLLSMTWPEGERGQPPAEQAKDKLPCYRTTADDYRKAWEKVR